MGNCSNNRHKNNGNSKIGKQVSCPKCGKVFFSSTTYHTVPYLTNALNNLFFCFFSLIIIWTIA